MSFKDFSYLELWLPFCSVKGNHFAIGHYEEQFCEFISNLDQWFMRTCCLKDLLSGALAALLFTGVEPFFKNGIMGKIHVKLYEI